jgi:RNA polymerase sigma-70 factor (ECF subfamily)
MPRRPHSMLDDASGSGQEPAALLERARNGDVDAFAAFVRLFERRVRAVLGRLLDDERDVHEAAQDTFVQAWRHLDRFRGESAPFTWLYRIAVNEALQRTRRKRLDTRSLESVELERGETAGERLARPRPADTEAAEREELSFVAERLRALPFDARAPLVLRDLEGWSYEDVADTLGVSVAAVKSRVHRARMQLRAELDAWRSGGSQAGGDTLA